MDTRSLVWAIRRVEAACVLRRARNALLWRRGLGRWRSAPRGVERARVPGVLVGAEPAPGGGLVRFARSTLRVQVTLGGAVFLGWDGAESEPSYALARGCPPVDPRAVLEPDTAGGWRIASERALVVITRHGMVEVRTRGGVLLRRDMPPRWWERSEGGAARWALSSEVPSEAGFFAQGGWAVGPGLPDGAYQLRNARTGQLRTGVRTSGLAMPTQLVVAGSGGHLVFYDSTWRGEFRLRQGTVGEGSGHDRPGRSRVTMTGGPVRYWVVPGAPARALRAWARLTGAAAVPPDWALGYQHAVEPRRSGAVSELVASFARHGLPLDGLHLGAVEGQRPVAGLPPGRVGELRVVAEELARTGAGLLQGLSPTVATSHGEEWYECGRSAGVFVGGRRGREAGVGPARRSSSSVSLPDFTQSRARQWWGRLYAPYLGLGVGGFGHEWAGRQASALGAGERGGRSARVARYAEEERGGDRREAHNVQALAMSWAADEALRAAGSGERPLLLSSTGWAGIQRYGGVCGQVSGDWAGLRAMLTTVLGLGLSGVPFAGVDVGDSGGGLSPELYLRMFQLASFLPMFRTRSSLREAREPWLYGDVVLRAAVAACARRERLLPYLVALAHQAAVSGAPMARPLWWSTPSDRGLRSVGDAFLLGDALLVAPVVEAGAVSRTVRLPSGTWYDTSTDVAHRGPGWVTVEAPLESVPVFARAGAVVPQAGADDEVELEVWPPLPGRSGGGVVVVGQPRRERRLRRLSARWEAGVARLVWEGGEPVRYPVVVRGVREQGGGGR